MKNWKSRASRVLIFALVLAMSISLAACGGGSSKPSESDDANNNATGTVYVPSYTKLKNDDGTSNSFSNITYANGSFYASRYEVVGTTTEESASASDIAVAYDAAAAEDTAAVDAGNEVQVDVYGTVIYRISTDGSMEKINYEQLALPEGADGNVNLQSFTIGDDGSIYLVEDVYTYTVNAPEGVEKYSDEYWNYYESSEEYHLRRIAPDGSVSSDVVLNDLVDEGNYFYVSNVVTDANGNIYIPNDTSLFVLDGDGNKQFTLTVDNWIDSVFRMPDGTVAVTKYGSSGYELTKVDTDAKAFGDTVNLPNNVYNIVPGSGDYDFYYSNSVNLFGYKIETGESTKLFNWLSCGVDSNDMSSYVALEDGSVAGITAEWNSDYSVCTNELVKLTPVPASSVAQKKTITLATLSLDYNSRSNIINFNKTNTEYTIEVTDYSEYNTDDDDSAGLTKLTAEILSGKMPDILDTDGMPMEQLEAKGFIEDLYPYLDSDSQLSRDDIFPSVLTALENNGKLYSVSSGFSVVTAMGSPSIVGDTPGWTYAQFNEALSKMPEGCTAFDEYVTRDVVMYYSLALDLDSFVNWETGECSFDTDEFKNMLTFIKSFPAEYNWEEGTYTDSTERIASGQQMLLMTSLSDFEDFQMYKAIFGGSVTFIGFPTDSGTGNMLSLQSGYAISSQSQYKDAAWQFLRTFLTESYQESGWYFPTNKNAFDAKLKKAMTPTYQKDENGNFILDENGNKIEESQGGWIWGSISIEIKATTQEEADQILDLINSTTKVLKTDESIKKIVTDESQAFFEGQKTVDDVAKTIQSKAKLYVNEQR